MSDRWLSYFENNMENKHWLAEAVNQWQFMQPLFGHIQNCVPPGSSILDVGCGMGFNDTYIASLGYEVTGIDNDPRIIEKAKRYASHLDVHVNFKPCDAFDLSSEYGKHDLAFSLGVLEHFDRDITIQLLSEQSKCARHVLIEIPTKYTAFTGSITDERIYSIRQLKKIVNESDLKVVASFGFGDVMATPYYTWLKRLLPHGVYRLLQNNGLAYCIAVIGKSQQFCASKQNHSL